MNGQPPNGGDTDGRPGNDVRTDGTLTRALTREQLVESAGALLAAGHRLALVAGHDDGDDLRVVYLFTRAADDEAPAGRRTELSVVVPRADAWVPSLAAVSFSAGRFERALRDQFGIEPAGHPRPRRLVHHAHWPDDWYPMRHDASDEPRFAPDTSSFAFVPVEGAGVYEIPVGPVHAGMIEPGHFRFSVVGETIVRMKARLWFVHRGMEKLFEGRTPEQGVELAEKISGDTSVGHALTYARAVEAALDLPVPEADVLVRALLLELERVHNHVADIGAICNDVGFGIVHQHTQRLREQLLRINREVTGHRLGRGAIGIGGSRLQALPDVAALREVGERVRELVQIALDSSVLVDRFTGTAVLRADQAAEMGVLGYVARASGLDVDARRDHPWVDLGAAFAVPTGGTGDVLARFRQRVEELAVSVAVIAHLVDRLDGRLGTGPLAQVPVGSGTGSALVEAWRGTACHRVEIAAGRLRRVAVADPSFFTWPALPVALADTIVPDFPLANKSFNQSYAGNDL